MRGELLYFVGAVLTCLDVDTEKLARHVVDEMTVADDDNDERVRFACNVHISRLQSHACRVAGISFDRSEACDEEYYALDKNTVHSKSDLVERMEEFLRVPRRTDSVVVKRRSLFRCFAEQCDEFRRRSPTRNFISIPSSAMFTSSDSTVSMLHADRVASQPRNGAFEVRLACRSRALSRSTNDVSAFLSEHGDSELSSTNEWKDTFEMRIIEHCIAFVTPQQWYQLSHREYRLVETMVHMRDAFAFFALAVAHLPATVVMASLFRSGALDDICEDIAMPRFSVFTRRDVALPRALVDWLTDVYGERHDDLMTSLRRIGRCSGAKQQIFMYSEDMPSAFAVRDYRISVAVWSLLNLSELCSFSDLHSLVDALFASPRPQPRVVSLSLRPRNDYAMPRNGTRRAVLVSETLCMRTRSIEMLTSVLGIAISSRRFVLDEHVDPLLLVRALRCAADRVGLVARRSVYAYNRKFLRSVSNGDASRWAVVVFRQSEADKQRQRVGILFRDSQALQLLAFVSPFMAFMDTSAPMHKMCGHHVLNVASFLSHSIALAPDPRSYNFHQSHAALSILSSLLGNGAIPHTKLYAAPEFAHFLRLIVHRYASAVSLVSVPVEQLVIHSMLACDETDSEAHTCLKRFVRVFLRCIVAPQDLRMRHGAAQMLFDSLHGRIVDTDRCAADAMLRMLRIALRSRCREDRSDDLLVPYTVSRDVNGADDQCIGFAPSAAFCASVAFAASAETSERDARSLVEGVAIARDSVAPIGTVRVSSCLDARGTYDGAPRAWSRNASQRLWNAIFSALLCNSATNREAMRGQPYVRGAGRVSRDVHCHASPAEACRAHSWHCDSVADVCVGARFGALVCARGAHDFRPVRAKDIKFIPFTSSPAHSAQSAYVRVCDSADAPCRHCRRADALDRPRRPKNWPLRSVQYEISNALVNTNSKQ